jgi:hypothetical protein
MAQTDTGSCASQFNVRRLVRYLSTIRGRPLSSHTMALLWYDYTLTWTHEVQYFWTKRFTLSTALYIPGRYGMVTNVLYTLALADKLPTMRVNFASLGMRLFLPCSPHVFELEYHFPLTPAACAICFLLFLKKTVSTSPASLV